MIYSDPFHFVPLVLIGLGKIIRLVGPNLNFLFLVASINSHGSFIFPDF